MLKQINESIPELKDYYYIDDNGNLYNNNGTTLMTNCLTRKGYVKNCLVLKNGKTKGFYRHRLVMICFNPINNMEEMQVNHIDGNKLNNNLSNLEWCTCQENRIHATKNNLCARMKGETNPAHKLTEEEAKQIIQMLLDKVPYSEILKHFNCSKSTISAIKNKRNWKYLTKEIEFN